MDCADALSGYFRRRRIFFAVRPDPILRSRFALAATRLRYWPIISSAEAPPIRLLVALTAVPIFSLTISRASRRAARLPPSMSFIIRRAMTPFASTANLVREFNIAQ
jgi:hypothetical protein